MVTRRRNMVQVDVYPEPEGPGLVFALRCSAAFELYSMRLKTGVPIKATASWTRIFMSSAMPAAACEVVPEPPDNFGLSDGMRCGIDDQVFGSPRAEWPRRYLDWLHDKMLLLAAERSWDPGPLIDAYHACLATDLTAGLRLESKPKSSPDRRHRAVVEFLIDLDGVRDLRLVIRDREGKEVAATERSYGASFWSVRDFRALARDLRWRSGTVAGIGDAPTGEVPDWVLLAKKHWPESEHYLLERWEDMDAMADDDLSVALPYGLPQ